ncbi:2-polyprenyl-6-methoxyphenol hydroxylase-like FAD-dependent oxidoreductase [Rhodoligotrophos appendicifer]|uniref:FAD-dependent oxidoreductase n=1 Tax=Rhodoligotrophos appendicifer TaxID=987056 RepID=UPI001185FF2C|nr:FAD-dependent oxidoreductase [Rhodoligotrophos appendicifer]
MVTSLRTQCCIAGGGPAGMMLGFLLARAGVEVIVLEKHKDFLRDFRGDTIHPSTLELMAELGEIDRFLTLPHQKVETLSAVFGEREIQVADFRHLPTHCKFIAFMPQWDFLNFLHDTGRRYPTFRVMMETEAEGLIHEDGEICGVTAATPNGPVEISADLVVAADGRRSTLREQAGLMIEDLGSPIDVLWFRMRRHPTGKPESMGRFGQGYLLVQINRGDYWQCAFVIHKGGFDAVQAAGLEAFRQTIATILPESRSEVQTLESWEQIKLLTVQVDRLKQWWEPGLLCIGDAAHAMSPIGGVGINLAIQDAVAAANEIALPLREGRLQTEHLSRVQARRSFPTKMTQRVQVFMQDAILSAVLDSRETVEPPLAVRMIDDLPYLSRFPARLVGMGLRPEHIRTPDAFAEPSAPAG